MPASKFFLIVHAIFSFLPQTFSLQFFSFAAACDAREGVLIARCRKLMFRLTVKFYEGTTLITPMK
jgi:hypothetical protein